MKYFFICWALILVTIAVGVFAYSTFTPEPQSSSDGFCFTC